MALDIGGKIGIFTSGKNEHAENIITAAFVRSFSHRQICRLTDLADMPAQTQALVLINPGKNEFEQLQDRLNSDLKLILLGKLDDCWAKLLGIAVDSFPPIASVGDTVMEDHSGYFSHSPWKICYRKNELTEQVPYKDRYLSRYDFTDEWNNHGYGRVWVQGDETFALSQYARCLDADQEMGWIENESREKISSYCVQRDEDKLSLLWFNRTVGSVDSLEWTIIERYLSSHRSDELFCFPYLLEVPAGFTGVSTMRIDCDQAIASARPLFELYCQENIPFSLAILTGLPMNQKDWDLIQDVKAHGGAIVSHSVHHYPDWGGSYEIALQEASESKRWLENAVPEQGGDRYLVSPFHQNPRYAVQAMADAGYAGFIGGIIHNDPDYLLARSGVVPYMVDTDFFSLSQQCMLHGDCFHRYGNSMAPYLESFQYQFSCDSVFGYLDHPFSSAYQYGWEDEAERLAAHYELIRYMKSIHGIWFCNLYDCMQFCKKRTQTDVWVDSGGTLRWTTSNGRTQKEADFVVQAQWRNDKYPLYEKMGNMK